MTCEACDDTGRMVCPHYQDGEWVYCGRIAVEGVERCPPGANLTDCTVPCPCDDIKIEPGETGRVVKSRQPLTGEPLGEVEITNTGTGTIHAGRTRPLEIDELKPFGERDEMGTLKPDTFVAAGETAEAMRAILRGGDGVQPCPSSEAERDRIALEAYKRGAGNCETCARYPYECSRLRRHDCLKGDYSFWKAKSTQPTAASVECGPLHNPYEDAFDKKDEPRGYVCAVDQINALRAELLERTEELSKKTRAHSDLAVVMGAREDRLWDMLNHSIQYNWNDCDDNGFREQMREFIKDHDLDGIERVI